MNTHCNNVIFQSKVIESINALWEDVDSLWSEFRHLKSLTALVQNDQLKRLAIDVGKSQLESLLGCSVHSM